jgi:hypothetical protein
MWLDRHMAADTDTHVWMVPVTPAVAGLSTADASALVKGSTFARRMRATDAAHGARLCDHGRLHFQPCKFCAEGVPAMPMPTFAEQRENAKAWL